MPTFHESRNYWDTKEVDQEMNQVLSSKLLNINSLARNPKSSHTINKYKSTSLFSSQFKSTKGTFDKDENDRNRGNETNRDDANILNKHNHINHDIKDTEAS